MRRKLAPEERNGTADQTVIGRASSVVADAGAQARSTATETTAFVADHAPEALAAASELIERALAALRRSSSGSLELGTVFAAGLSGGMLLSRAPRLLVALAFLPTLLLGGTLLGRGTNDAAEPPAAEPSGGARS
jgi:hypothetical protein